MGKKVRAVSRRLGTGPQLVVLLKAETESSSEYVAVVTDRSKDGESVVNEEIEALAKQHPNAKISLEDLGSPIAVDYCKSENARKQYEQGN